jgi:hypothetical protein
MNNGRYLLQGVRVLAQLRRALNGSLGGSEVSGDLLRGARFGKRGEDGGDGGVGVAGLESEGFAGGECVFVEHVVFEEGVGAVSAGDEEEEEEEEEEGHTA